MPSTFPLHGNSFIHNVFTVRCKSGKLYKNNLKKNIYMKGIYTYSYSAKIPYRTFSASYIT